MVGKVLAVGSAQTLDGEKQLINSLTCRHVIADEEDTRHGSSRARAVVGKAGHGVAVMSEQNLLLASSPGQDDGIGRLSKPDILDAHDIQNWHTTEQSAQDSAVEVFVSRQLDHRVAPSPWRAP